MRKNPAVLSYSRQTIEDDDRAAVLRVLDSPFLTQGPEVPAFEDALCAYTGCRYAVAVANGTAALHLAVCVLDTEKGKEGITSPITFAASANALLYNNLAARFADIDEKTACIDPARVEKLITADTRVMIPVHYAGNPADMAALSALARRNSIRVIEDAAHAIGSRYADGSMVGNCRYSDMTIFSFHPVKNMTTGEGGAITTNDAELYRKLKLLRSHGITKDPDSLTKNPGPWYYEMQALGFNYRLTDIQAALGISQLKKLDRFIARRREIVRFYNKAFAGVRWLSIPDTEGIERVAYHLYTLRFDFGFLRRTRSEVMDILKAQGVGTQVLYIPVYLQPYYRESFGYTPGSCPRAEAFYEQALSVPLYPAMTDEDAAAVVEAVLGLEK